jgi:hypothetical protein
LFAFGAVEGETMKLLGAVCCGGLSLLMLGHAVHKFEFNRMTSAGYLFMSLVMGASAVALFMTRRGGDEPPPAT